MDVPAALSDVWTPHPGFQRDYLARSEDVVMGGGAKGPGKTDCLLADALGAPEKPGMKFDIEQPRYKAIILRRTFPELQDIIQRSHARFGRHAKWKSTESRWMFPSGSSIGFGHCQHEEDKRRYWGQEWQFVGYDQLEYFTETQFRFINLSNRSSVPELRCRIRATANPGGPGHWWVKRMFIDGRKSGVPWELKFDLPDGHSVTKTFCFVFGSYKDNPSLNHQYLAQLMDQSDIDRQANLEGDWNIYLTQSIFGSRALHLQQQRVVAPKWVGDLVDRGKTVEFMPAPEGMLKIFEMPKDTEEYVIGADVSHGYKGSGSEDDTGDASSAHVINRRTWDVVASWHGWVDPEEFGRVLADLGYYYCNALLGLEVNGPGIATLKKVQSLDYPNLYFRNTDRPGWETNMATRGYMISTMQGIMKECAAVVYDQDTLDEMSNFLRNQKTGKIEARSGCLDDRVMSLGIAWQIARMNPSEKMNPQKAAFGGGEPEPMFVGTARNRPKRDWAKRLFRRPV